MDVRLDPLGALGYEQADAHVLRNAGAVVTDDVVRSIIVSQRLLGTRRVDLVAHTDCGIAAPAARELATELGRDLLCFDDVDDAVRASIARLHAEPDLDLDEVRGFVYEVERGKVRPVDA
jgi:carbonic anhydrase